MDLDSKIHIPILLVECGIDATPTAMFYINEG
jgi:hypothetical protein